MIEQANEKWIINVYTLSKLQSAQTLFVNNFIAIASQFRGLFLRNVSWY